MTSATNAPTPLIWAHRGARSLAPENTLAAARVALAAGAHGWELDVRLTRDGVPVLAHDLGLLRVSSLDKDAPVLAGAPAIVTSLTLSELRALDFGSWFARRDPRGQVAAGVVTPADLAAYEAEPICTLAQALEFTQAHDWRMNLELKPTPGQAPEELARAVAAQLAARDLGPRLLVSSFSAAHLIALGRLCPGVALGWLVEQLPARPTRALGRLGAVALHPHHGLVTPELVAELHQAGMAVNVWTVNAPADLERMLALGVDGIITDFPQRLAARLAQRA